MNRRGFLASILAAAAAPAIVRADALMRIVPRDRAVLTLDMIDRAVEAERTTAIVGATIAIVGGELGRIEGFRFIESPDIHGRPGKRSGRMLGAMSTIVMPYDESRELSASPGAVKRLILGLQ